MTTSLFGNENPRVAYNISTDTTQVKPEYVQDTPKEDHILCSGCEHYFSILETYVALRVTDRFWKVKYNSHFDDIFEQEDLLIRKCNELNPVVFRLFTISILWRCSISSTSFVQQFKVDAINEELMRKVLHDYLSAKQADLLDKINTNPIPENFLIFKFLVTPRTHKTNNILFIHPHLTNPYHLFLNEYLLIISLTNEHDSTIQTLGVNYKRFDEPIKISCLQELLWDEFRKSAFDIISDAWIRSRSKF